jgi:hypothetical protein
VLEALLSYASRRLSEGQTPTEVQLDLMAKGLDREPASLIVQKLVSERLREGAQRSAADAETNRWAAQARSDEARSNMVSGAVICVIGILITVVTYSAAKGGGTYVVAWGAIAFGAIRLFKGLAAVELDPVPGMLPAPPGDAPVGAAAGPTLLPPTGLDFLVVLLMTQQQVSERIDRPDMVGLTRLVQQEVNGLYFRGEIEQAPLALFVLVKPGPRMKVWAEGIDRELRPEDVALFEARTPAWKAPDVRGTIALAYTYQRSRGHSADPPRLPRAWRDAATQAGQTLEMPDGLAAAVWPD